MLNLRENRIVQALVVVAAAWLVIKLSTVILLFFVAMLFVLVLHPVVNQLKKWRIPTGFAVLIPVLVLLGIAVLIGFFVIPTFVEQIDAFAKLVPTYVHELQRNSLLKSNHFNANSIIGYVQGHTSSLSSTLLNITTTAITILVGVVTIIVVTLYGVGTYDRLRDTLLTYVPKKGRDRAADIIARVEKKIVTWVYAQLLLSTAVGLMVWIGSFLLGLPFAGILGLLSGVLELVPTLGPIPATVPGFLLGLTISLKVAIFAIVLHLVVAQIEAHLLAPWLLGRTVHLHPIVIIFSLLVGTELYGILGTLLAVPAALVISAAVDSFRGEQLPKGALVPAVRKKRPAGVWKA